MEGDPGIWHRSFWLCAVREAVKKLFFLGIIPILYVKFWRPLFLVLKFTFLFLNLAKIQIFIPKSAYGGGGTAGSGIIPKNKFFLLIS